MIVEQSAVLVLEYTIMIERKIVSKPLGNQTCWFPVMDAINPAGHVCVFRPIVVLQPRAMGFLVSVTNCALFTHSHTMYIHIYMYTHKRRQIRVQTSLT